MTIGDTIDYKKILELYSPSGVYDLRKMYAVRHEMPDPCCDDPLADVTYFLVIWRRPKFFLFNYIQPAVLINILALCVFLIPAESGEKITLGISTMLNMTVFLMTVMSGLPPTDQTPLISIYYAINMVITTATTVLGVLVLRIHHQGRRGIPVPEYLRTCARWLAVVSCSHYPRTDQQLENLTQGFSFRSQRPEKYVYNEREPLINGGPGFQKKKMLSEMMNSPRPGIRRRTITDILDEIRQVEKNIEKLARSVKARAPKPSLGKAKLKRFSRGADVNSKRKNRNSIPNGNAHFIGEDENRELLAEEIRAANVKITVDEIADDIRSIHQLEMELRTHEELELLEELKQVRDLTKVNPDTYSTAGQSAISPQESIDCETSIDPNLLHVSTSARPSLTPANLSPMYSPALTRRANLGPRLSRSTSGLSCQGSQRPPSVTPTLDRSRPSSYLDLHRLDVPYIDGSPTPTSRAKDLWHKAVQTTTNDKLHQRRKHARETWKDLSSIIMEERWKHEERKEIIGEEWRKISRILDKFLFMFFLILSFINTVWCIFASPYFPDSNEELEDDPHIPDID